MALVHLDDLTIGYRGPPLLDGVTRQVEAGQRIGLLGRNGSGKTTLLRMIAGQEQPDRGRCVVAPGTRVAYLSQEVPQDLSGDALTIVRQALDAVSSSADLLGLARLHNLTLSESSAQSWLESRSSQAPSAEMLASLSQGLSASAEDEMDQELTDEEHAGIAGGGRGDYEMIAG